MTIPDNEISASTSTNMRVVIATSEGQLIDRNDIVTLRIGHRSGFSVLDASTTAEIQRFEECGLEWRSACGAMHEATASVALIEVLHPGTVAIACATLCYRRLTMNRPLPPACH
jgi:hypothetical protein